MSLAQFHGPMGMVKSASTHGKEGEDGVLFRYISPRRNDDSGSGAHCRAAGMEAHGAAFETRAHSTSAEAGMVRDPESYDVRRDGCRSQKSDVESAANALQSEMDDVDSRVRDVQDSCGYDFTINRMSPLQASENHVRSAEMRLCRSYRNLAAQLGAANILKLCEQRSDHAWCATCLGVN
jgi:hypothetical protein